MCGICGMIGNVENKEQVLQGMMKAIAHRGTIGVLLRSWSLDTDLTEFPPDAMLIVIKKSAEYGMEVFRERRGECI